MSLTIGTLGSACAQVTDPKVPNEDVGLFTPGHRTNTGTALSPSTAADGGMKAEAFKCIGMTFEAQEDAGPPADCLKIEVATDGPPGDYDKQSGDRNNNGAIWIEDDKGNHVVGLETWVEKWALQGTRIYQVTKLRVGCPEDPDIITGPTLTMHQTHMLVWKCQDIKHHLVPDGNYRLWVEVQVDEKHPLMAVSFPFTKGKEPFTTTFPAEGVAKSVTLKYTPVK